MRHFLSFIVCIFTIPVCFGQEVTVINNFPNKDAEVNPQNYVLKKVTQHTYIVNEYEPAQSSARAQLMQLISYSLRSYTDNQYYSARNNVVALEKGDAFTTATGGIVGNAIWIHDYSFHDDFPGFSKEVTDMASRLSGLSGYSLSANRGEGLSMADKRIELYLFQRLVYDLKMAMEKEVARFLDIKLPDSMISETQALTESETSTRPQLKGLDVSLEPFENGKQSLADLKPQLPVDFGKPRKTRRNRRDGLEPVFSERMVALMEENNRILSNYGSRFENLQSQITDERWQRNEGIELVREEVRSLRELVKTALSGSTPPVAGGTVGASDVVEVVFERNAHELTPAHKASLNRIGIAMKQDPGLRGFITGFADRSGNPDFNAWISEQRAQAVFSYLTSRGVAGSRLDVSHVGDAASDSANPSDRKVVVQLR